MLEIFETGNIRPRRELEVHAQVTDDMEAVSGRQSGEWLRSSFYDPTMARNLDEVCGSKFKG